VRVRASCKKGFLGNAGVVTDCDLSLIVEPYAFADPAVIPDFKIPGELYPGSWSKNDALTNLGAEKLQGKYSQARRWLKSIRYQ
jgi:hypothetical protein